MNENEYKIWCVAIGNFVEIQDLDTRETGYCQLVDFAERSKDSSGVERLDKGVSYGRNSIQIDANSRLGKALINKQVGDVAVLSDGEETKVFMIKRILA